jgi:hypothetical protein
MHDSSLTLHVCQNAVMPALQAAFIPLQAKVEQHARIAFRDIRCQDTREDAIAEAVAIAWSWFRRLTQRGKNPTQFSGRLARFACSHVLSGRRLCGQDSTSDVLSPIAQRRRGFAVVSLRQHSTLQGSELDEALQHNTQSEVPEQVSFRIDFPRWRGKHSSRNRRVIDALMRGERSGDVARQVGVSPARVSQIRRELHDDWQTFHDESPAVTSTPLA